MTDFTKKEIARIQAKEKEAFEAMIRTIEKEDSTSKAPLSEADYPQESAVNKSKEVLVINDDITRKQKEQEHAFFAMIAKKEAESLRANETQYA